MHRKLLFNDFRKNPWNNLILLLFISLSVMFAVAVFLVLFMNGLTARQKNGGQRDRKEHLLVHR